MSYSYATAKALLSETEKNRILALYLSTDQPNVDWDKATEAFGAASVASMKKTVQNSLKKIADAGGKTGVTAASTVPDASSVETPKKQTTKGRKRKADTAADSDDETPKSLRKKAAKNTSRTDDNDDDDDDEPTTKKTPKTFNKKAAKKATVKQEVEDDEMGDNINVASAKEADEEDEA